MKLFLSAFFVFFNLYAESEADFRLTCPSAQRAGQYAALVDGFFLTTPVQYVSLPYLIQNIAPCSSGFFMWFNIIEGFEHGLSLVLTGHKPVTTQINPSNWFTSFILGIVKYPSSLPYIEELFRWRGDSDATGCALESVRRERAAIGYQETVSLLKMLWAISSYTHWEQQSFTERHPVRSETRDTFVRVPVPTYQLVVWEEQKPQYPKYPELRLIPSSEQISAWEELIRVFINPHVDPVVAKILRREALERKCSNQPINSEGETKLMQAVNSNDCDTVEMLLSEFADPNQRDIWGRTALHFISHQTEASLVERVLVHASPLARDTFGYTALHRAIKANVQADVIETLIQGGVPVDALTNTGKTALDLAIIEERGLFCESEDVARKIVVENILQLAPHTTYFSDLTKKRLRQIQCDREGSRLNFLSASCLSGDFKTCS